MAHPHFSDLYNFRSLTWSRLDQLRLTRSESPLCANSGHSLMDAQSTKFPPIHPISTAFRMKCCLAWVMASRRGLMRCDRSVLSSARYTALPVGLCSPPHPVGLVVSTAEMDGVGEAALPSIEIRSGRWRIVDTLPLSRSD